MLFPAEFDFIFRFNFCTDLRLTSNPCQIYMHIAGSLCDTGFPHTFYGEKICSVYQSETLAETIESGPLCITDLFQNESVIHKGPDSMVSASVSDSTPL